MAVEKRELLRPVGGVVGGIQIDGDATGTTMQTPSMTFDDVR
jgi:hypothetical protein